MSNRNPNILLITNDQHRWNYFEGGPISDLRTPGISRLRREGTTLNFNYSTCPLCVPTRFSWLYGLRASQGNGAWGDHDTRWPIHLRSMAHGLKEVGYHTALVGKLHSHSGLSHLDLNELKHEVHARGFDDVTEMSGKSMAEWFDCTYTRHLKDRGLWDTYLDRLKNRGPDHADALPFSASDSMDAVIGAHARRWLEDYDGDKPFFLHASFCNPHGPYDPPMPWAERHDPSSMPPPLGVSDPDAIRKYQKLRALYCGLIEHCDDEISQLLALLDEKGLTENTVVVFCSDHGDMLGDRGLLGKHQPYEASARIPLTVRYPGRVPAGVTLDLLAESIDLPCTLLEAAGRDEPVRELLPTSPSRSFWSCVTGQSNTHRPWAYSEMGPWKMVCDGEWKFVYRRDGKDELFCLKEDPEEQFNRAEEPEQRDRIHTMQRWIIDSLSENIAPPC